MGRGSERVGKLERGRGAGMRVQSEGGDSDGGQFRV